MNYPITEADLQAWVDGLLPAARAQEVADYLAERPAEAARLHSYREQNAALRQLFDPLLDEAVPARLRPRPPSRPAAAAAAAAAELLAPPRAPAWRARAPLRYAAMLALTLAGGAGGWLLHEQLAPPAGAVLALGGASGAAAIVRTGGDAAAGGAARDINHEDENDNGPARDNAARPPGGAGLARRAAVAHAVYSPELRHPVEVGADQQQHLVAWLSKRLGTPLRPPQLQQLGYALEGGRLLPGQSGPVAQFMYRDGAGQRLTLYVSTEQTHNDSTGFRFTQEGRVGVFYWIDGKFGYALSGALDKTALGKIAGAVYAQLEPAS
jgi:anti-sigma factor RsiW